MTVNIDEGCTFTRRKGHWKRRMGQNCPGMTTGHESSRFTKMKPALRVTVGEITARDFKLIVEHAASVDRLLKCRAHRLILGWR
jgi:hypothetical protein